MFICNYINFKERGRDMSKNKVVLSNSSTCKYITSRVEGHKNMSELYKGVANQMSLRSPGA